MIIKELEPLAKKLFEFGAIKFGEFQLHSGLISPIYINLRNAARNPQMCSLIVAALRREADELAWDLIADIPQSISPIVACLMYGKGKPMVTPLLNIKDWGTKVSIQGNYKPGQRVLLIDDVVTKANSALNAAAILEAEGLLVEYILVLINRKQGGAERLKAFGYDLHYVFDLSDLLKYYLDNRYINSIEYETVIFHLKHN